MIKNTLGIFYFTRFNYMKLIKSLKEEVIPLSSKQSLILYLIIACVFQFVLFYTPALADEAINQAQAQNNEISPTNDFIVSNEIIIKSEQIDEIVKQNFLPEHGEREVKIIRTSTHVMTAYNSDPRQTDDTPCITANGFNVCEHGIEDTIASNFLKFGTKVKIPELFGDRVFIVRDRMNKRYPNRVDIWMKDYDEAIKFGIKVAKIQIIE
jgi:3D (Asp-Asp-Asp) domain-containing protein